ncbi:hypothetical protein [Rhodopseudomonas sp.]|jgi:hypothetical protein|uniref:hypothetical protein n=1 Tax=Rhodopseudomonas sp. TaxID=1078 RepID=UPI003B3B5AD3
MRALPSLKLSSAGLAVLLGLAALAPAAQAANPLEMNFWLSGPRYDGNLPSCEAGLPAITHQFAEKEGSYWNSDLRITGYARIQEVAFRPWQSDNIPRRFCTGDAILSDGQAHRLHYSIIEDGGLAGFSDGVEFCIVGLDRNWAFNPACKAAKP